MLVTKWTLLLVYSIGFKTDPNTTGRELILMFLFYFLSLVDSGWLCVRYLLKQCTQCRSCNSILVRFVGLHRTNEYLSLPEIERLVLRDLSAFYGVRTRRVYIVMKLALKTCLYVSQWKIHIFSLETVSSGNYTPTKALFPLLVTILWRFDRNCIQLVTTFCMLFTVSKRQPSRWFLTFGKGKRLHRYRWYCNLRTVGKGQHERLQRSIISFYVSFLMCFLSSLAIHAFAMRSILSRVIQISHRNPCIQGDSQMHVCTSGNESTR